MFQGFLQYNYTELINRARTAAYLRTYYGQKIEVKCDSTYLNVALGHAAYTNPAADNAPWYRSSVPHTAEFLGFFPTMIGGIEDSTRELTVTELASDSAIQSLARHGSKEIRVKMTGFARTERGMGHGLAWLRATLDDASCGPAQWNCTGRELEFFSADPSSSSASQALTNVSNYGRVMYRVETLDAPRVISERKSKTMGLWATEVEFILNAGLPWAFTYLEPVATTNGVTPTTVAEVYCPTRTDAFDELVVDPQQPTVERPPRPPSIHSLPMPEQWSRYTMTIGSTFGQRHGRVVPYLTIITGSQARRQLRIRFYRTGNDTSCDFEGEFYITYIPPDSLLMIDAADRSIRLSVGGNIGVGEEKPGANLVVGSNGRPPKWPSMACGTSYRVVVDAPGGLAGTSVLTDVSIRE